MNRFNWFVFLSATDQSTVGSPGLFFIKDIAIISEQHDSIGRYKLVATWTSDVANAPGIVNDLLTRGTK